MNDKIILRLLLELILFFISKIYVSGVNIYLFYLFNYEISLYIFLVHMVGDEFVNKKKVIFLAIDYIIINN